MIKYICVAMTMFLVVFSFTGMAVEPRLCLKSPSSARERDMLSSGKDGEAGDIGFIVDVRQYCRRHSQAVTGPLEARSTSQTKPQSLPDVNALGVQSPFVKDGRLDLDAAVKYFEDLYRSTSSIARVVMTVTKPRSHRTIGMKVWTRGQDRSLILIQSPQREQGTATLRVDRNLWNYLPRIKRTIRIPPSMMLSSWMGSDFTNDDLVRESSFSKDYFYRLLGPSSNPKGWRVRFDAKPDMVGLWNRIDLILSEDGTIPLKADYYNRKNELARTIVWSDIRTFGTKRIPATMTLTPKDKKGYRTEMTYTSLDFDVNVPDDMFSLSQLEQLR